MTAANNEVMRRAQRRARGFTLVELAVVVTIIGILAMLAVAGYRKLVMSSHTTEATEMVNAIKVGQESYHAETGQYANISPSLTLGGLYPAQTPTANTAVAWGGACTPCSDQTAWQRFPVHASGPMRFGYATMGGPISTPLPSSPIVSKPFPANSVLTGDWFVVSAMGDMDGNNVYCTVVGVQWQRDLLIDNDGE
jgi:type IV pilus assembly protein PilA